MTSNGYSKYNTSYYVDYISNPSFLTSELIKGPYTVNKSLQVNVKRKITDKTNKELGNAFYFIDFQVDETSTFLNGPYVATQVFSKQTKKTKYTVYKSGIFKQNLVKPVNSTNYNQSIVKRANLVNEIVQSVIVEDTSANKIYTFTNVFSKNSTPIPNVENGSKTIYTLNFDNAILTGSINIK